KKYETIEKVINGFMTRKEASIELKLSLKQIDRLKSIYYSKGKDGFIHGNRGKVNPNKKNENLIKTLEELYLEKHFDFNFEHFYEEHVFGKYDISYDAMLKAFTKDDIISPLAHKKTVKLYKDKMNEVIKEDNSDVKEEKVQLFKSRIIETEKAHPRRSSNLYAFGQEVQMDACNKMWFGGIPSFLHLAVDKATKKVLFGWFEYEEITRGYYVLLFNMIINYGIPQKIKADNRSTFSANNAKNKEKKVFMTQFGKVCERLDIVLHTTSVSTAKANVERENKTFKDRLIAELRYEGITDIDEANKYLNEVFITKMNKRFSYAIDKKTSLMRENTYTEEELKLIISERKEKIIDNASCISYNHNYYIPIDLETGEVINFQKGTKCTLIIDYDGEYIGEIENKYYKMLELENRDSIMKKESEINPIKKEHHKYIPPANHPWRKNMMLKH
ncbi:MAG: ISNCY family transposase, partial [Bacilli bacterium]